MPIQPNRRVRSALTALVVVVLLFAASGCASMKIAGGAVLGGVGGFLVGGPVLGAVGAGAGALGGDVLAETNRVEKQRDECKAELASMRADIIELRATIRANEQIDDHNLNLPAGKRVRHVEPEPADEGDPWYRVWLKWLGAALALAGGIHFRRGIARGAVCAWRFVRAPPDPIQPPPDRSPLE